MGGKSRKTGNISLSLIQRIKAGGNLDSKKGKAKGKGKKTDRIGFDLSLDDDGTAKR
jgi:hypothetical protein